MKKQTTKKVALTFTKQTVSKLNTAAMEKLRGGLDTEDTITLLPTITKDCGSGGWPVCNSQTKPIQDQDV